MREKRGEERVHSLSEGQRLIWFADQMQPGRTAFHFPAAFRIHSEYSASRIESALRAVANRHESLRTTFGVAAGEPVARVRPRSSLQLEVVEAAGWDEAQLRAEAAQRLRRPLDLEQGPLFQAVLLERGASDAVLLLLWHHIVIDGWSASIVLGELAVFLGAKAAAGKSIQLPAATPYSAFVEQQQALLASDDGQRHAAYWREQIHDRLTPLELPLDRPRPSASERSPKAHHVAFPEALNKSLRRIVREQGVTLYSLLLTGLQVLLHRYSGAPDVCVQSPFAGRDRRDLFGTVGYFVQVLPMVAHIEPDADFRSLLRENASRVKHAFEHQHYPIAKALSSSSALRGDGLFRLSRVMFVLQQPRSAEEPDAMRMQDPAGAGRPRSEFNLGDLRVSPYPVAPAGTPFDIDIEAFDFEGALDAAILFNPDVLNESTVERIARQWLKTLASMAADLGAVVGSTEWMDADEEREVLAASTGPERDYPASPGIPGLFERQVDRTPDAIAAYEGDRSITFAELDRDANRLARRLATSGAGPGGLVGVYLPRSIDSLTALLAVLKTGAAYVPLDTHYPAERLGFVVEDCALSLVVTHRSLDGRLPAPRAQAVFIDDETTESTARLGRRVAPEDRIHVLHTSGSTGRPKGVEGLHGAALNRLQWMWEAYPFEPDEVCCATTPLGFVDSVWETFGPLLAGVPLVMVDHDTARDVDGLTAVLAERSATRIVVGPGQLRALLEHPRPLSKRLPLLARWTVSGEALPPDLARLFLESAPDATLLNLYGCSEAAGDSCFHEMRRGWNRPRTPIGRPIANTSVYLLDPHRKPVPPGVAGEIYIGGAGLAAGYLNRPGTTEDRFVSDPFSDRPDARLFRTGDLGRLADDGEIEYLGRLDSQVQIRGCRVEIGEIEAALRRSPQVAEAVVEARIAHGETRLAAYVKPLSPAQVLAVADLRADLSRSLPDYMLPSDFIFLDELPRTPNGKLDRRALPPIDQAAGDQTPPESDLEELIVAVLCDVLDLEQMGVHDDFFELGGHSLTLARAVAQLNRTLDQQFPLRWVFEASSVRRLADRIMESPSGSDASAAATAILAVVSDPVPPDEQATVRSA